MMPDLPSRAALLLDFDGTLVDIAPTPDAVIVPIGLADSLRALRTQLGGALAIVTGRPIEQVDEFLPDVPYAIAGEHGGAIRHSPHAPIERIGTILPPVEWLNEAEQLAEANEGVLLERKARGFVLHFRLAPILGPFLRHRIGEILKADPKAASEFTVMAAHMAWEIKPSATDKGRAVTSLMSRPPFSGREPIYVGDDVTDEDGMDAARKLGGRGYRVDEVFEDPAGVRAWLAGLTG